MSHSPSSAGVAPPERALEPLTVAEALRSAPLARGRPRVLAGSEGLGRPLRWVHVAEVANVAALLRGGELLLTTGRALLAPPAAQREFVAELARRGVAGLVLELGQSLSEAPAAALAEARRAGLPFVVLEREVRFVDVTEELHRRLVDRQLAVLRRAELLDRTLTGLVSGGEGMAAVVEALATAIDAPVVLRGPGAEVVHRSESSAAAPQLTFAVAIPGPAGSGFELLLGGEALAADGYEALAAARAASVIALLIARADHERLLALRARGAFLGELADGAVAGEEAARAARLGFAAERARLLPFALLFGPSGLERAEERTDLLVQLARELELGAAAEGRATLIGVRPPRWPLLGLVAIRRGQTRVAAAEALAAALREAVARRYGEEAEPIVVIGPQAGSLAATAEPLRLTLEAAAVAAEAPSRPWHDAAVPDLEHLLVGLRDDERLARFAGQLLRPVLVHDEGSTAPLLPTLVALTDNLGRRSATARALGIRRQSLYERLRRLEPLLGGASLDDPDTLLGLRLALRARRLAG